MKLSLILEAIDRASGPTGKVAGATRRLTGEFKRLDNAATRTGSSMGRFLRNAELGERVGLKLGRAMRTAAIGGFGALSRGIDRAERGLGRLALRSTMWAARTGGMMLGTAAAGGLIGGLYKIVNSGLMFEKFRTQLTGLQGSVAAGNKAMDWVTNFARTTPYELEEVMSAFIQLKAYGIDPTDGSLQSLGNTAAGMGKDLMAAVEMIADAMTGEFERLKEFGVKASQKGNQVTLSYMKDGKAMTVQTTKNAADIKKALMGIFDGRFAGGMDRLAATTAGKWSNLMDRLTIMSKDVWEHGVGAAVNKQLDRFSAWVEQRAKDHSLEKWANDTGSAIGNFIDALGPSATGGAQKGVNGIASAFNDLASAIRGTRAALDWLDNAAGWFGAKEKMWGKGDIFSPDPGTPGSIAMPPWWRLPGGSSAPAAPARPSAQRKYGPSDFFPRTYQPGRGPLAAPPKGAVKISLELPAGVRARTTGLSATGMDLEVATGRAMGSIA